MKAHVVFDIDELVSFGTLKLSTETLRSLTADMDQHDTGHHVGEVALIHSARVATNERLAVDAADRRYQEEFGKSHPDALGYYRSQGEEVDGFEPLKPVPAPESILNRKTGDISARISRFTAATAAVTADPEGTMRMPDGTLTEPASAHLIEQGPDEAPCEEAEEVPLEVTNSIDTGLCKSCGGTRPDHTLEQWRYCKTPPPAETHEQEWLRKEQEENQHPAA